MEFAKLMQGLADTVSAGDGGKVAQMFTSDGVYHDVYYGEFTGHEPIKDMVENWFHKHATDFKWDFHEAVTDGKIGFARYVFSYVSTMEGCKGNRALFEGVSLVELDGDKIKSYREVANIGPGLVSLGFNSERTYKILKKHSDDLSARDESKGHLK